jgi:hypothetical protein
VSTIQQDNVGSGVAPLEKMIVEESSEWDKSRSLVSLAGRIAPVRVVVRRME